MRGGTSKGCVFLQSDLPERSEWDALFVAAMDGSDPKQIDGLGGCVSSNNKIVVVSPCDRPGIDIEYLVGQCVAGEGRIDYHGNCGNMTSVVAPFAIENGLIAHLSEPYTTVRLLNLNTNKCIDVTVPVSNGHFDNTGNCCIAGVSDGTSALRLKFLDPTGSKTGHLFPTGLHSEILEGVQATILDVSIPTVLVHAAVLGLTGAEMPETINSNRALLMHLEQIRAEAACRMGFVHDPIMAGTMSAGVPKIGIISPSQKFTTLNGITVNARDADICVRMLSMGKAHKACPLTAAAAIASAAQLDGTLARQIFRSMTANRTVRLATPSGVMSVTPELQSGTVHSVTAIRTARIIMQGTLFLGA